MALLTEYPGRTLDEEPVKTSAVLASIVHQTTTTTGLTKRGCRVDKSLARLGRKKAKKPIHEPLVAEKKKLPPASSGLQRKKR